MCMGMLMRVDVNCDFGIWVGRRLNELNEFSMEVYLAESLD